MTVVLPVVYLAAGEGRRLRPLTDAAPKALLDVGGVSLGERALSSLRRAGVEEVVAVTGHAHHRMFGTTELGSQGRGNTKAHRGPAIGHNELPRCWSAPQLADQMRMSAHVAG